MQKTKLLIAISILFLTVLACNSLAVPSSPTPKPAMTTIVEVVNTPTEGTIPLTEADVPRISPEQAKAAVESGTAIIIDVRSKENFATKHIAGAINIPLNDFETHLTGLGLDKNQWIITYCTWPNEHTSARAAFLLLQNGYTRANPILGGLQAWIDAGYPVEP